MPWQNVTLMEEIDRFVMLARSGRFTVTDLCEQFGISRKAGYKHLARYAEAGLEGSRPRSHRPHRSPQRTPGTIRLGWDSARITRPMHLSRSNRCRSLSGRLACG